MFCPTGKTIYGAAIASSRLVTDSHHLLRIINDMSSDDNLSNEDDNHSISLMLGQ